MDALKNVVSGGSSGNANANNATTGNTAPAAGAQKDDYGDKGAAYINKKYLGGKLGHDQLEKITDSGREAFEKSTGKHVPEKFSN